MKNAIIFFILFIFGCNSIPVNTPDPYQGLEFHSEVTNGLSSTERLAYYRFNYGIEWLPFKVLANLKRPNDFGLYDELFLERPERFGLYRNPIDSSAPPIGITVGFNGMTGVNCSTCHTSIIAKNNNYFIIDGANSQFAIDRFIKEMLTSMIFTLLEPGEFEDFYQRIEGPGGEEGFAAISLNDYQSFEYKLKDFKDGKDIDLIKSIDNFTANPSAFNSNLHSRFGLYVYMLKRIKFFVQQAQYAKSESGTADSGLGRSNPWSSGKNLLADKLLGKKQYPFHQGGPVNTPPLWGYRNSEWIFYSGVTNSMLERNTIQAIALLSDFDFSTYQTTISIKKMQQIEDFARKIKPPVWNEEILGKIDRSAAQHGSLIFNERCRYCHQESKDSRKSYPYMDVGTDPQYHLGQIDFYNQDFFKSTIDPFLKSVKMTMAKNENINLLDYEDGRFPTEWRTPEGNVFEARPLNGIWASAPYLHNGSIRTIRELLKPSVQRERTFQVGGYRYNTEDLGFENEIVWYGSSIQQDGKNTLGNKNTGHEFGTDLLESEKNDLIEFLKTY